jgi:hypothetical protein
MNNLKTTCQVVEKDDILDKIYQMIQGEEFSTCKKEDDTSDNNQEDDIIKFINEFYTLNNANGYTLSNSIRDHYVQYFHAKYPTKVLKPKTASGFIKRAFAKLGITSKRHIRELDNVDKETYAYSGVLLK